MDINSKLSSLQEISKVQLSKILSTNPNKKHLVLEPSIIRPLERVCGVQWLKSNGVEKIFKLDPATTPNFDTKPVFYLIYASMKVFRQVTDQIRSKVGNADGRTPPNHFHIIVAPRHLYAFEEELEELGLIHSVIKLHSFTWLPIYLDGGVLSMEMPHVYGHLFLAQDLALLPALSKSLWQLCFVVGKPKFVVALGHFANIILRQFDSLCEHRGDTDKLDSDFGGLVMLDRSVDYASALLTPGTYAALINEVYRVTVGVCECKEDDSSTVVNDSKFNRLIKKRTVNFNLNDTEDSIYCDIKNRYFTEVTTVLSNLTKQLKTETSNSKEMGLDEMKRYVQTQLQSTKLRKKFIANHLQAAETIIDVLGPRYEHQQAVESDIIRNTNKSGSFAYLEELIFTENNEYVCLRLFCLLAITQKLSDNEIGSFWKKYLHQFGYKYSYAYCNLIKADFINEPPLVSTSTTTASSIQSKIKIPKFTSLSTNQFYVQANRLKQIPNNPEKINLKFPTCASYVFGGSYIPLVTQIASMLLNSTPLDEIKTKLELLCGGVTGCLTVRNERGYPLQPRTLLVYVIGGVTYAEIAACNLLETLTGSKIVVLSDRIITGDDLMSDILTMPKN